jgi:hypothetical protein
LKDLYTGVCVGGPLDGKQITARYPRGFILVDKPENKHWLYVWDGDQFNAGNDVEFTDDELRVMADLPGLDVIAAPWVGGNQ